MSIAWAKLRAMGRTAINTLIGLLFVALGFAIGVLDVKADGDLKLSTWIGCAVLIMFGGWLMNHALLEQFIGWSAVQGKRIAGAIYAAKQPPPAGGAS